MASYSSIGADFPFSISAMMVRSRCRQYVYSSYIPPISWARLQRTVRPGRGTGMYVRGSK